MSYVIRPKMASNRARGKSFSNFRFSDGLLFNIFMAFNILGITMKRPTHGKPIGSEPH